MARRRAASGLESSADLARKVAVLERELALQRDALEKLKDMGKPAAGNQLSDRNRPRNHEAAR
jgi:hypothetical protein